MDMELAKGFEVAGNSQAVIEIVREALQSEGFGIISTVNVSDKVLESTGNLMPPYVILGACNLNLSYWAIPGDQQIGLPLPCNVVVIQMTEKSCNVILATQSR